MMNTPIINHMTQACISEEQPKAWEYPPNIECFGFEHRMCTPITTVQARRWYHQLGVSVERKTQDV